MTSLNKMIMEEEFEDYSVDFLASMHDSNSCWKSIFVGKKFILSTNKSTN